MFKQSLVLAGLTLSLTANAAVVEFLDDNRRFKDAWWDHYSGDGSTRVYRPESDFADFNHYDDGQLVHDTSVDIGNLSFEGYGQSYVYGGDAGEEGTSYFEITFAINGSADLALNTLFTGDNIRSSSEIRIHSGSGISGSTPVYYYSYGCYGLTTLQCNSLTDPVAQNDVISFDTGIYTLRVNNIGDHYNDRNSWDVSGQFLNLQPVPIPAAGWLFGSALIGLVGYKRK